MWIVQLALRRPYTFVVLAILILLFGAMSALRTATDIFPPIKIRDRRRLDLHRSIPVRYVGPNYLLLRADAHDDGEQY